MPTLEEYLAEVPEPKSQFDSWLDSVPDPKDRPKIEGGPSLMDQVGNVAAKVSNVFTAPATLFSDEFRIPTQTAVDDNAIPVTQSDGSTRYEVAPLGDRVAREGGILGVPLAPTEDVIRDLGLEQIPGETGIPSVLRGAGRGAVAVANSLTNPINAAMIPIGLGPENAITRAGAAALGEATLPNIQRAAAGGFGAQMLSGVPEQVESLNRSETAGQKAEALVGLTGNLALGGLGVAHAASPRVIAALNSDLPATASVLAQKDLSKTINETETNIPEGVLAPEEQSTQQPATPLSEQGAEVVSEPAVTPDLAGFTEEIINEPAPIQSESDLVLETQTEAAPEAQAQEVANELPEITADVPSPEAQAQAQRSVLDAIEIIQRPVESAEQGASGGNLQAQSPEQQLGSLEAELPKISEEQISSLEDRRTKTTEHDVYFSPDKDRYVKVLQRNQFGLVPKKDAEGRIGLEKATLPEYLDRIRLTNEIFGTDISIEGVARRADELDDDKTSADLVISQKNIRPVDTKNANPTLKQIEAFMQEEGFEAAPGTHKWTRESDGLLVGDAKPDNFILTKNGVVPIDLLISQETVAEAAQPTTQNAQEYSQSGRSNVAEQNEGSPREVVVEEQGNAPRQGLPTQEVNESGRENSITAETGSTPVIGKWDGTNYGPKPLIAFRDKTSGEVFISPNDRIHALGLGNLVAEGNTNLVKPTNRESGFLIGNEFIEGSLQNPKDGDKITSAMERAAEPVIENKKSASFDENLASDKTRVRLESIARAKNIPEDNIPDVVQNALVKAKAAEQSFNPEKGAFSTWVNTIGRNAANDFLRQEIPKNQRETSLEAPIGEESTIADTIAAPETADVSQGIEVAEARERINTLLKDFPEGERNVLLAMQEGLSNSEIAERLGMKPNVVRSLQSRGLAKLRNSPYILGLTPDNKFTRWFSDNLRRLFVAEGDLPTEVFHKATQRTGAIKEQSREIAYATRDLYNSLKEEFKISKGEEFFKGMSRIPKEFVARMNDALLGRVDMDTLPEAVRGPLQAMRDHVDALSQKMIDEGLVPEELKAVVGDNMGVYLTRSYRMFDDPKWREKIEPEVYNKALNFILKENQKFDPTYSVTDARRDVDAMLQDWQDEGTGVLVKKGAKLGSKDLSSFIRRKDIPEELRNLLGEYKNPVINYARSVTKMASVIANEKFLRDVRKEGLGKFLFEDGTQPPGFDALIAAPESRTMAPMNGLRTTPQIAAAFAEFNKADPQAKGLWRTWLQANALAKTSKTVGSVMTQVRNTMGQPYFWLLNGHWNPKPITQAGTSIFADLAGTGKKSQEVYKRYLRLGVVDQSTAASELRDVLKDAGLTDPNLDQFDQTSIALQNLRKYTIGAAEKSYQLSDDIGKIVGFENELATQKAIHPEWTQERAELEASQRIRNTYPTYSMVPEWVRQFRKQPFFGPFVTFAYESYRTFAHNLKYAAEDLQSDNAAQRASGARRAAGILAVMAGGYGLSAASRAILGISPEEADDARQFMAPWDRNSQLLFTGKKPGDLSFVNLSYANPYSGIADLTIPIVAGLNSGEGADQIAGEMFAEAIQPFANEGILAAKLIDVARNQTAGGREVYNPSDPDKASKIMGHIAEALEPGTLNRLRKKIIPAFQGKTTSFGDQLSPTQEIAAELTGVKQQTLDYAQALGYKASDFREADANSERIFRDVALRRGTVEPQEVIDSYTNSNTARFELWKQMYRAIRAAQRRGVPDSEIKASLLSRNVTQKDASKLLKGIYSPYTPSQYLLGQLRERKRTLPQQVRDEIARSNGLSLGSELE